MKNLYVRTLQLAFLYTLTNVLYTEPVMIARPDLLQLTLQVMWNCLRPNFDIVLVPCTGRE